MLVMTGNLNPLEISNNKDNLCFGFGRSCLLSMSEFKKSSVSEETLLLN